MGDAGDRAAALEAVGIFLAGYFPGAIAILLQLAKRFAEARPAYVIAVPGAKPLASLTVSAAKAAGIPTIDVQTLLIGTSQRDPAPISEFVAAIDDSQAELYQRRFGLDPSRLFLAGHEDFPELRKQAQAAPVNAEGPALVVFPTQPLSDLSLRTLHALVAASRKRNDVVLEVLPHPDDRRETIELYRKVLAEAGDATRFRLGERGSAANRLAGARVVVTIASNIGLWAAVMEKDLLVVDFSDDRLPIRFHEQGIALVARTPDEVQTELAKLLDDPAARAALAETRGRYLARNPQLCSGSAVERVVAFAEQKAAGAPGAA